MTSYCRNFFTLSAHQRPTVGDTKISVYSADHLGWMKCDGRLLSVPQYLQLWQVIGYSFTPVGNTNRSTFNLPDPRGTVPGIIGTGTDSYNSNQTFLLGQQYGEYAHRLINAEMPRHDHGGDTDVSTTQITLNDPGHAHTQTTVNDDFNNSSNYPNLTKPSYPNYDSAGSRTWTETINTNTTGITLTDPGHRHPIPNDGGDGFHNNVQPTLPIGNMFIYSGYGRGANGVTDPKLWPYMISTIHLL
jgi:microcystin-dependent protein